MCKTVCFAHFYNKGYIVIRESMKYNNYKLQYNTCGGEQIIPHEEYRKGE